MNSQLISLLGFSVLFALLAYSQAAPTDLALRGSSELADGGNTRVKRQGGGCGCGCCGCGGGCGCCCCRPRCCCRCCCCKTCCCTRCCTCCRPCCCCCRPCCGCGCGCCGCGGGRKRRSLQKLAAKLAEKKRIESAPVVEAVEAVEPVAESVASPALRVSQEAVQKRSALNWSPLQAIADLTLW